VTYDEALDLLPATYAEAVRLRRRGLDKQSIAVELGVDEAAIGTLLRLAEAKLRRLLTVDSRGTDNAAGPVDPFEA